MRALFVIAFLLGWLCAVERDNLHARDVSAQIMPTAACTPNGDDVPAGQTFSVDDPMRASWCYALQPMTPTAQNAANGWRDTFASGVDMQRLNDGDGGYRVFNSASEGRIKMQSFVHHDYWQIDMVDASLFRLSGGSQLSPNRAFAFDGNGRLVVEAQAAAGNWNTGGADIFYEIDISPAAAPTGVRVDNLYGYGTFGAVGAIGCRLQRQDEGHGPQGVSVCAQYDDSRRDAGGTDVVDGSHGLPGRIWETQGLGDRSIAQTNVTRDPTGIWRQCRVGDDDELCRDHFRLELTRDSLLLYVNGFLQREVRGIYATNPSTGRDNRVPDAWFGPAGVHVYLTSWINGGRHSVQRFKWGDIAVNPDSSGDADPTATPTASPATPTATPKVLTPTPTATAVRRFTCRVSVELNGTPGPYRPC